MITFEGVKGVSWCSYSEGSKRDNAYAPHTLRIEYSVSDRSGRVITEWVCPEHKGRPRKQFEYWWSLRTDLPPPDTAAQAVEIANRGGLMCPTQVYVVFDDETFDRIHGVRFGPVNSSQGTYYDDDYDDLPF